MITIYEEDATEFDTLGLGVLRDVTQATVNQTLNGEYTFSFNYPVDGSNYEYIRANRIVCVKPDPYSDPQPFRIHAISKPINRIVTVDCYHISYDMNGVIISAIKASDFGDAIKKIQNGSITGTLPFTLVNQVSRDSKYTKQFIMQGPSNLKAIISGGDDSILSVYDIEVVYDKFSVYFRKKRGANRGVEIRYAKNMTDLKQDISTETLYNGVYPYYHKETTENKSNSTDDGFQQAFIVGKKAFQDGWLSFEDGGEPYHPIDESPIQISTDGAYKNKVYCWNNTTQRYEEKIYNESITLIQGVVEPTWIKIDWSSFPIVKCVAQVDGYFKKSTDSNWGTKKHKGESVFEGSVLSKDIVGNMMMSFSEVIPPSRTSTTTTSSKVEHVDIDDKEKIIWLTTNDAKQMKHQNILPLDLTSEFDSVPSADKLRARAEEYIKKNKLGQLKKTTDVSFIDLSGSDFESGNTPDRIELGDNITIIYKDLGVNETLRVISYSFDAIANQYTKVTLGEKAEKLSDGSVMTGDNVSSLTNDTGYTDETKVQTLIAQTITADYIQAKNASLTKAQIEELETARIKCTGILEASQFEVDKLVAKLLVADNAEIKDTLKAGTVEVAGDITINKGSIHITNGDEGTVFSVDRNGHATANALTITGGSINIQNDDAQTVFNVDEFGNVETNSIHITGGNLDIGNGNFNVTNEGVLTATGATITGFIKATSGEIGGCGIENGILKIDAANINGDITAKMVKAGDAVNGEYPFQVDGNGHATASDLTIKGGSINIQTDDATTVFKVKDDGSLTATKATITGSITATSGNIGGCEIDENGHLSVSTARITGEITANAINLGSGKFVVDTDGVSMIQDAVIDGFFRTTDCYIESDYIKSKVLDCDTIYEKNAILWNQANVSGGVVLENNATASENQFVIGSLSLGRRINKASLNGYILYDISIIKATISGNNSDSNYYKLTLFFGCKLVGHFNINSSYLESFEVCPDNIPIVFLYRLGYGNEYLDGRLHNESDSRRGSCIINGGKECDAGQEIDSFSQYSSTEILLDKNRFSYLVSAHGEISIPFEDIVHETDSEGNVNNKLLSDFNKIFILNPKKYSYRLDPNDPILNNTNIYSRPSFFELNGSILPMAPNRNGAHHIYTNPNENGLYLFTLGNNANRFGALYTYKEVNVSDRKLKRDISYDLSLTHNFFSSLKPASFRFNNNKDIRFGFIAQDVEQELKENSMNESYALVEKTRKPGMEGDDDSCFDYSMSYTDLIALLVYEVQNLEKEIDVLKKGEK